MKKNQLISTPIHFWQQIQAKGGLNVKDEFYDKPIIDAIKNNLGIPAEQDLDKALKTTPIGIEEFIYAFFLAVSPFSKMMQNLLAMFEKTGIKHAADNLEIEFDFGIKNENISFNIEQFKNLYEKWETISKTYTTHYWNSNSLGKLHSIWNKDEWRNDNAKIKNRNALGWLESYQNNIWLEPPMLPTVSDPDLNNAAQKSWQVLKQVVDKSAYFSQSPNHLIEQSRQIGFRDREDFNGLLGPGFLGQIETDHCSGSFLNGLFSKLEKAQNTTSLPKPNFVDELIREVEDLFKQIPSAITSIEEKTKKLEEFLDLPIWKKRHELYSAWVSTQIMDAVGYEHLEIHQVDGKLVFAFSGTHFATTTDFDPNLFLWAELRSPLADPVGKSRTSSIQPDYTILKAPVSAESSAILVVECKQYKKQSTANFTDALLDYARGHINAKIILVNYGPVSANLIEHDKLGMVKDRVLAIGNMHPGFIPSIELFKSEVQAVMKKYGPIKPKAVLPTKTSSGDIPIKVTLTWGGKPTDLDLHLFIAGKSKVDYKNKGSQDLFPNAVLVEDVTTGSGPETIEVYYVHDELYHLYVHNFSGEIPLRESNAVIDLEIFGFKTRLTCPTDGDGTYWNLLLLNGGRKEFRIVNEITEFDPD